MKKSVTIVVPTYNEKENIAELSRGLHEVFSDREHEIIYVDDKSPDGTGAEVERVAKELDCVRLITKDVREGIGAALRMGFDAAKGEHLASLDADLSFRPEDIKKLVEKLEEGVDLAVGCRHTEGGHYETPNLKIRFKFMISRVGNFVARIMTGLPVRDYSANCRGIRASLWKRMDSKENRSALLVEMLFKAHYMGGRIEEVPVTFTDRIHGESKLNHAVEAPRLFLSLLRYTLKYRF